MLITDPKGLYTINVDPVRKIVFETPVGSWTKEDYSEFHNTYVEKVKPTLGNSPWCLCTDVRKYKLSDIADEISRHADWMNENNLQYAAVIVDSAIVKMQINRAGGNKVVQQAFMTEKEADDWLKSKGF